MAITTRGAAAPVAPASASAQALSPAEVTALDDAVEQVADHASAWAATDATSRAELLTRVIADTMAVQEAWLADACAAKGLKPGSAEAGEELYSGIGTFVRMARLFRDSLRDIARQGKPSFAGPVTEAPDGRLRVRVFPATPLDRITFPGTTAEVYMQPDVTRASLVAGQAAAYADPAGRAGTALVLAAGNVASAGPARCALQALRRGQDRRDEGQPGQRLPRPPLERRPVLPRRGRRPAHRQGRSRRRPAPDRPPAGRRGAHHRVGQDLRRRRLRYGCRRGSVARRPTTPSWPSR